MRIEGLGRASEVSAELEVLAAVRHPGLVPLVDFGVLPDGRRFVARPFVEGADLADSWATRPDEALLVTWLEQLLEALAALHRAGFAHGDLKPTNVLVDTEGDLRLVDFGLARPVAGEGAGPVGGTLYYAAPELLLGEPPDAASDLFALGVLAHELLVGDRRPAAEFYADFPRRDFLEAAGTRPISCRSGPAPGSPASCTSSRWSASARPPRPCVTSPNASVGLRRPWRRRHAPSWRSSRGTPCARTGPRPCSSSCWEALPVLG